MGKKSVKLYTDNVIEEFYKYVKAAVEAHYGRSFTLKHVEDSMRAEGWSEDKGDTDNG
jgi:hypothetical protein